MSAAQTTAKRLRIRRSAAIAVTAAVAWIASWPLAFSLLAAAPPLEAWWSIPLGFAVLAAPVAVSMWSWRSGVDVTAEGIAVRGLVRKRLIPWSRIDGFATGTDGVSAILDDETQVRLVPMRPDHLATALEIGGQRLRGDDDGDGDDEGQ
jgi:hypothetical protein